MPQPTRQTVAQLISKHRKALKLLDAQYARLGRREAVTEDDIRAAIEPSRAQNAIWEREAARG